MNNKQKHLEFITGAINRMSGNLFFLRGWTITLISALFALFVKNTDHSYIFIVYFLIVTFWILDGYFLSQERLFRALYDHVRKLDEKDIDFSMHTNEFKKDCRNSWFFSMFSSTLIFFYFPLTVAMLVISFLIKTK
jgi:hypothetical protein